MNTVCLVPTPLRGREAQGHPAFPGQISLHYKARINRVFTMTAICRLLLLVPCIIFKVQASASTSQLTDSVAHDITAASEESEAPHYYLAPSLSASVLGNMLSVVFYRNCLHLYWATCTWYTACHLAQKASGVDDKENSCLFFASLVTVTELPALGHSSPEVYYPFWYQILRFSGFGLVIYQASCPIHVISTWYLANTGLIHFFNIAIFSTFFWI